MYIFFTNNILSYLLWPPVIPLTAYPLRNGAPFLLLIVRDTPNVWALSPCRGLINLVSFFCFLMFSGPFLSVRQCRRPAFCLPQAQHITSHHSAKSALHTQASKTSTCRSEQSKQTGVGESQHVVEGVFCCAAPCVLKNRTEKPTASLPAGPPKFVYFQRDENSRQLQVPSLHLL